MKKYIIVLFVLLSVVGLSIIKNDTALARPSEPAISTYFVDPDLAAKIASDFNSNYGYSGVTVDTPLTPAMITDFDGFLLINDPSITDLQGIGTMVNIIGITVNGSSGVTEIPEELGNLTKLTSLHLMGLGLKSLPASLENLNGLSTLDLSGNSFTEIPAPALKLSGVKYLWMSNNRLENIPADIGSSYPLLQDWEFYNNKIKDLSADAYNYLYDHSSEGALTYGLSGQSYDGAAKNKGQVGFVYKLDAFPIFSQFLSYKDDPGLSFTLIYPDKTSKVFDPTFEGNLMIIAADLLNLEGEYKVVVQSDDILLVGINEQNSSWMLFDVDYSQTFQVSSAGSGDMLPQTGGLLLPLFGVMVLGTGALLTVYVRKS